MVIRLYCRYQCKRNDLRKLKESKCKNRTIFRKFQVFATECSILSFTFMSTSHFNCHLSSSSMMESRSRPLSGRPSSSRARMPTTGSLKPFSDCLSGSVTCRIYYAFLNGDFSQAVDEVQNMMQGRDMPRRSQGLPCFVLL